MESYVRTYVCMDIPLICSFNPFIFASEKSIFCLLLSSCCLTAARLELSAVSSIWCLVSVLSLWSFSDATSCSLAAYKTQCTSINVYFLSEESGPELWSTFYVRTYVILCTYSRVSRLLGHSISTIRMSTLAKLYVYVLYTPIPQFQFS